MTHGRTYMFYGERWPMKRMGRAAVVVVVGVWLSLGVRAFAFTALNENIEVRKLLQLIARAAKINVVFDKNVKGSCAVDLRNVEPLKALELVAKINQLTVRKVEGMKNTYAIAKKDVIENFFDEGLTEVVVLKYAKASDLKGVISNALGKKASVRVEVDQRNNALILSGTRGMLDKVKKLVTKLDTVVPQVLIDTKIVQVDSKVSRTLGFQWDWGTDGETNKVLFAFTESTRKILNADSYQDPPEGAPFFRFGDFFRAPFYFQAMFDAMENASISRNLASPRLLAINGAKATLHIGDKVIYGNPNSDQPPEEKDVGLTIDVTPRINKDNFITIEVNFKQSKVGGWQGNYPIIAESSAETTVQVQDGEEVLIAGLVQEESNEGEKRVPFLSDLPILKNFFRHKTSTPETKEIVMLITPRVVVQNVGAAVADVGEELTGGEKTTDDLGDLGLDDDLFGDEKKGGKKEQTGGKSGKEAKSPKKEDDLFGDDSFDDSLDDL